jgi:membrane-associated phospholipid phosphatase
LSVALPSTGSRRRGAAGGWLAFAVMMLWMGTSSVARADEVDGVVWAPRWPRVRLWEGGAILALAAGSYLIEIGVPVPTSPNWRGPILFDDAARGLFRGRSANLEQTAAAVSDNLYFGAVLYPYIVDSYVVALGVHQSPDVALQMTLINLQSLGLAGVLSLGAEHLVGRQRPYVQDCGPDGKASGNQCGTAGDFQSFESGHAAATATVAALTCVHHAHIPLYGGGAPDALACAGMIGLSATTGVLRLVADRHYASDVIVGWAIGVVAGYVVPSWLHYGFGSSDPGEPKAMSGGILPVPQVYRDGAGVGVAGVF